MVGSFFSTGKTAILLNGMPGLRQGDPLSLYLFLAIAEILRCLLVEDVGEDRLMHPLVDDLPCLVVQYGDNTLIILRADSCQLQRLRKSMLVPIHVPPMPPSFPPSLGV
ncbi:hypothetical protein ACQ4PT_010327 [Festuca glaucescens]